MSQAKRVLEEQGQKRQSKLDGYRKKLNYENTYEMDCPFCCEALSHDDMKEEHCFHDLPWNIED